MVGRRRGGGDGAVAVRGARELALAGLQVVGGRPLLQQGLVVHGGRRPPRPARLPLGLAPDCVDLFSVSQTRYYSLKGRRESYSPFAVPGKFSDAKQKPCEIHNNRHCFNHFREIEVGTNKE